MESKDWKFKQPVLKPKAPGEIRRLMEALGKWLMEDWQMHNEQLDREGFWKDRLAGKDFDQRWMERHENARKARCQRVFKEAEYDETPKTKK